MLATACTLLLVGCVAVPPTPPAPDPTHADGTPSPAVTDAVTPTPLPPATPAAELTLTVRVSEAPGLFGQLNDDGTSDEVLLQRLVMSTLYRLDDEVRPAPDLAEECAADAAGTTITCRLREAWFHDGSPVIADDVVFSFETLAAIGHESVAGRFSTVTAVDPRTVEFRLEQPDAAFVDGSLTEVAIGPRALHQATFERLVEAASPLPDDAQDMIAEIAERRDEAFASDDPAAACSAVVDDVQAFRQAAPSLLDDEVIADRIPWVFDVHPCATLAMLSDLLAQLISALEAAGGEFPASSYAAIALHVPRIGSGPFRVERHEPGVETTFAAHERYHDGRPAIDRVVARLISDEDAAAEALRRGEIDLIRADDPQKPGAVALYELLRDEPGVTIATYPVGAYQALQFNVRPGRLFHERELRQALALCIDKAALVDTATSGAGTPLDGPLLPVHWAYQRSLSAPARDVGAARSLIESVGWTAGEDGIYERNGRRLATEIWIRSDFADRIQFVELVAQRARDCGMQLTVEPVLFDDIINQMVLVPPHVPPGREEPFDLYFGGWGISLEPHSALEPLFHSDFIPHEPQARGDCCLFNYIGYSNPDFDARLEAARRTYDRRERARLYRELQQILAEDLPYVFSYAYSGRSHFTSELTSLAGPLNLESLLWDWQLESLTLAR